MSAKVSIKIMKKKRYIYMYLYKHMMIFFKIQKRLKGIFYTVITLILLVIIIYYYLVLLLFELFVINIILQLHNYNLIHIPAVFCHYFAFRQYKHVYDKSV